jgi:hypothetical protein
MEYRLSLLILIVGSLAYCVSILAIGYVYDSIRDLMQRLRH